MLTDVVMPGLNGQQVATLLRARWRGLRVVFMSGYTDDTIDQRGLLDSGALFLQKPFTSEALLRVMHDALQRRG